MICITELVYGILAFGEEICVRKFTDHAFTLVASDTVVPSSLRWLYTKLIYDLLYRLDTHESNGNEALANYAREYWPLEASKYLVCTSYFIYVKT